MLLPRWMHGLVSKALNNHSQGALVALVSGRRRRGRSGVEGGRGEASGSTAWGCLLNELP